MLSGKHKYVKVQKFTWKWVILGVSTHVIATFYGKKVTSFLYNKNFIAFGIIFAQGQKAKARFQQLYFPNILANLT